MADGNEFSMKTRWAKAKRRGSLVAAVVRQSSVALLRKPVTRPLAAQFVRDLYAVLSPVPWHDASLRGVVVAWHPLPPTVTRACLVILHAVSQITSAATITAAR